jgi:hypothetical protein
MKKSGFVQILEFGRHRRGTAAEELWLAQDSLSAGVHLFISGRGGAAAVRGFASSRRHPNRPFKGG